MQMETGRRKTEAINLRMSPAVKGLLRAAAERDHRTLSNLLEVLILEHCQKLGIEAPPVAPPASNKRSLSRGAKGRR